MTTYSHTTGSNGNGRHGQRADTPDVSRTEPIRSRWTAQGWRAYIYSGAMVLVAAAPVAVIEYVFGYPPFSVFLMALAASVIWVGRTPTVTAWLLAVLISDFCFVEPKLTLSADLRVAWLAFVYLSGAVISYAVVTRYQKGFSGK